jgi:hypothetical protein
MTNDETDGGDQGAQRTKFRSPNFPVIGLRQSMNRIGQLYKRFKRNPVPIGVAHKEWEFKEHSARGNQIVGALKAFGLVDVEGQGTGRRLHLTDLAYRTMTMQPSTPDWYDLLKKAALSPPLYEELWRKWESAEPELIKHYLLHDRVEGKFNPDSVDSFIDDFLDSLRFSQLLPDGSIDPDDDFATGQNKPSEFAWRDTGMPASAIKPPVAENPNETRRSPAFRDLPVTLPHSLAVAVLHVPVPMSKGDYKTLVATLTAMESALVTDEKEDKKGEK